MKKGKNWRSVELLFQGKFIIKAAYNINTTVQKTSHPDSQVVTAAPLHLTEGAHDINDKKHTAAYLFTVAESDDEKDPKQNPIFTLFVLKKLDPSGKFQFFTNLNMHAFFKVFELLRVAKKFSLYSEREWKCQNTAQDLFLMILITLKQGGEKTFFATMVQKILWRLKNSWIVFFNQRWTTWKLDFWLKYEQSTATGANCDKTPRFLKFTIYSLPNWLLTLSY